jgi:hypothetical protein
MGDKNAVSRDYLASPERFAQIFNVAVFSGREMIQAEGLRELDGTEQIILQKKSAGKAKKIHLRNKVYENYRDIIKMYRDEAVLMIFGIENQDEIHYAMPLRHMLYDAANYEMQWKRLKRRHHKDKDLKERAEFLSGLLVSDRLIPVITLCVYWGSEPWNGPRNLHELLDIPKELDQYKGIIGDYPLNLLEVRKIENLEAYSGELKALLGFIRYQKEENELLAFMNENQDIFQSMSLETAQAISVLGNVHEMESYLLEYETEDGTEEVDMCVAIQNIMHYCESAGKEVGRYEGVRAMILDNLEEGVEKTRIIQKLERHFSLSSEEAEEYYEQVGKNTVSH